MKSIMLLNTPSSWQVNKIGQIFVERREKVSDKEYPPLSVTMNGVVPRMEHVAKTDDSENRKRVRAGDIVINSRSDRKGAGGLSEYDGSVSLINIILEPRQGDPRFLHYLLKSTAFQEEFYRFGHGIHADLWTTRFSEMKGIQVALPDRDTQKRIADFLDRETARIDQLVEKKQRLVDLLAEKDKATVKLHVLGQIGERERKPNSTPWLPSLPIEWPIQRCAHIFQNLDHKRIPLNSEQRADLEKKYPYYGASGVIDHVDDYIFHGDNILVGEDGANLILQSTPIAFKAGGKYWVNNHAHILHPKIGYLEYWVHALNQVPYEIYVTGSAQPKLTSEDLANIPLPVPPFQEQVDLFERVENERRALIKLREPIIRSIDRLKEYRAALITAAVTGQIDVSNWAKRGEGDRRLDQIADEMAADAGDTAVTETRP